MLKTLSHRLSISSTYFFILLLSLPAFGQWSSNPAINTPVCTASMNQTLPVITTDGDGGSIIAWQHQTSMGLTDIYAQRIDSNGVLLWATDGVPVCTADDYQVMPAITSDGAGGAIITWIDERRWPLFDVYAQRLNASGQPLWIANGVAIAVVGSASTTGIINDDAGGALIYWHQTNRTTLTDIYLQRVNANGVVQWTTNGVAICTAPYIQGNTTIIRDGNGGSILVWQDQRNFPDRDIYAQRITDQGIVQWAENGIPICATKSNNQLPALVPDGTGGAIIAWEDDRNGTDFDIYTQRVTSGGTLLWTDSGKALCSVPGSQRTPVVAEDSHGGAVIAWTDTRYDTLFDIFSQRIDTSGNLLWAGEGIPVCTTANVQQLPVIMNDQSGGTIIVWHDSRNFNADIYAQRITSAGEMFWDTDGIPVSVAAAAQDLVKIINDGSGGCIATWQDLRSGNNDIYAQRIRADGLVNDGTNIQIHLLSGWNLLSIPLLLTDYSVLSLFPTVVSNVFGYDNGYYIIDTAVIGEGYWLKFSDEETITVTGIPISCDTFDVEAGWNLMGSISYPVPVSEIVTEPPGIIDSYFFGFTTSYAITDTLQPGKGYWIKVSQAGKVILKADE